MQYGNFTDFRATPGQDRRNKPVLVTVKLEGPARTSSYTP